MGPVIPYPKIFCHLGGVMALRGWAPLGFPWLRFAKTPPWKTSRCVNAQEELQRQQTERVAEERRQRAQELDDLARRAVTQMVSRPLRLDIPGS